MKYAVLPCNGLDKPAGPLARETALWQVAHEGGELLCPMVLGNSPDRYARVLGELPLVVIDGCATRCATKLANRLELKIARKVQITEEVKQKGATLGTSLTPGPDELALAHAIAAGIAGEPAPAEKASTDFAPPQDYLEVAHDKFLFRIPAAGFLFNENDVWVQLGPGGRRARIGISDYAQQQMTDITFVGLPAIGVEVDQFGEAGCVESAKATLELVCPVSGRVVAVNTSVSKTPELVNEEPYGAGWIAELELASFSTDRELLLDGPAYAEVVKGKAADY
jgi:glycine cleavage system H protein